MNQSGGQKMHPYEAARAVLRALYELYLQHGDRLWSVSVSKDGHSNFAHLNLDDDEAWKAVKLLLSKGLVEYMGTRAFVITDYGVSCSDRPDSLDHELPISTKDHAPLFSSSSEEQDFVALDEVSELLSDERLAAIVRRDVVELKKAIGANLPKCVALLAGSILEGVLIDVLDRNRALASSYLKKRKFPDEASLPDLLRIAGAALDAPRHLLSPTAIAMAHAVTDHRDLIHPHAEARGQIRVDETTARSLVHLVNMVVRDLVEASARGDVAAYAER